MPNAYGLRNKRMSAVRWRIEKLGVHEHERLKALRLRALAEAPAAFGTKLSDAVVWSTAQWRKQLEQMNTYVAAAPTADVGIVRCVLHDQAHTAALVSLWVAPESRGVGVAGQLVCAVLELARHHRIGRVVLDVVETNAAAIALYRKLGFVPNGERIVSPESCRGRSERQFELLL
jgi:ribosomal protein S18 acetylase RimI-like enzyme